MAGIFQEFDPMVVVEITLGNKKCTNDLPTHPLIFNRAIDTNIVKNRSIWTDTSNFACFGAFIEKM